MDGFSHYYCSVNKLMFLPCSQYVKSFILSQFCELIIFYHKELIHIINILYCKYNIYYQKKRIEEEICYPVNRINMEVTKKKKNLQGVSKFL